MSDLYENLEKRIVKKDLLDKIARDHAKEIEKVTRTQMRRIYDELKRLKRKVEQTKNEEDFKRLLPYIFMEKSKIAYTVARAKKNKKREEGDSYDNLKKIIEKYITTTNIKQKEDYIVFCDLIEAIIGFHYEKAPDR
ncbi:MAG: type III-A CRISPR-associated protein Csm2 [Spirochaetes bacterium]|nr:type III-A CRISPR-associated protein Csm2 [Spirochaetota bacterium]